jgi:mRNA degradation ribonuclease J1/J2
MLKVSEKTFIGPSSSSSSPTARCYLATGAQGDEFAALMRIAMKTHKYVKIKKGDTLCSPLRSCRATSARCKNSKTTSRARAHASSTATRWTCTPRATPTATRPLDPPKINPRFFMPMHGYHYMLRVHADIAKACGRSRGRDCRPRQRRRYRDPRRRQPIVRLKEMAPNSLRL